MKEVDIGEAWTSSALLKILNEVCNTALDYHRHCYHASQVDREQELV